MLRRIEQTIRERKLIRSGMRVIAAVSGGADSVAMLHALVELKDALGITLFVFHLDHGLRGRASNADALFVERLCKQLKVRGVVTKRPLIREKARPGNSIEMTARSARLEEMRSALSKLKADVVAVAHHADDQAETVLMRLLSGSGLEGLAGMDYESEPLPGLHVVRPMLDVSRKDIQSYLRGKKASWREDASNRSVRFRRNRIRHEMLPYLRKQGFAGVDSVLVRLSEIMRAENELIEQRTGALVTRVKIRSTDRLSLERLGRCHVADQRRILRAWIAGAGLPMRDVDFDWIENLRREIQRISRGSCQLSDLYAATWADGVLSLSTKSEKRAPDPVQIKMPGITVLPEYGVKLIVKRARGYRTHASRVGAFPSVAYIRRDDNPVMTIRGRIAGDSIQPTGMKGTVKIKDLFVNQKLTREDRDHYPLLIADAGIVWVPGYRVHRKWTVDSLTAPSWHLEMRRLPKRP